MDVKFKSYAEYTIDSNKKYPKFKAVDHRGVSKYKNIVAKGYAPNWSDKVFIIRKIQFHGHISLGI